jgi:phosphoribosyl-AMP cyclohydrolase / phosphoribosyl-ATP pyrophosphohydrolase
MLAAEFLTHIPRLSWEKGMNHPEGGMLLPAVVQDSFAGTVLMVGWVNEESLLATCQSTHVVFFSRSKNRLWKKGESSGHVLEVQSLSFDCDRDAVLILAKPQGPTCHRQCPSCFDEETSDPSHFESTAPALASLAGLDDILQHRALAPQKEAGSYVAKLFAAGPDRILRKVGEETTEFLVASKNFAHAPLSAQKAELVGEAADVLFHLLVSLRASGLGLADVVQVLQERQGKRREGASVEKKV